MANVFQKPNLIVDSALGMLQDVLVLPNLVSLNPFSTDFSGLLNDTITVRIELPTTADEWELRSTGVDRTLNKKYLSETTIDVKLTTNVYHAVPITDEEWTLDINNFAMKVLARQVRAVRDRIEYKLSNQIREADYSTLHLADADGVYEAMTRAGTQLNNSRIPKGRNMIVGSAVYEALLLDDRFNRADSAGDAAASAALQDARVNRVAGNNIFQVDTIPSGSAFLFHPTAFIMISRSPKQPLSDVRGADAGQDGIAMRWLSTYSQEDWADLSVLNTYCGFETVIDPAYTDDFGTHGDGFVRGARIQLKATTGNTAIGNTGTITAGAGANHTRQLTLVDDYGDNRARDPFVVWDSSDDTKATVSATGLVTGVGAGAVNITADIDGFTKTYAATVS
ncbi:MAG: hypothetical protein A4E20_10820 [Nitrospira sp. SG-bin2]|nr:MAG: hypothetical protein A4E20_10820 [Nitrospira sp. SG-bin2]